MRRRLGMLLVAAWLAGSPGGAWGQPPVPAAALVLDVRGAPAPAVKPFGEIVAGTTLRLPGDTRLVFAHYRTCRTVTVVGGTVTIEAETYTAPGAASLGETRTPCPRPVTLMRSGEVAVGGVLTRSVGTGLTLSPEPSLVLAGPRAGDFTAARITRDEHAVATVALEHGRRLTWPAGTPPLAEGATYELTLVPAPAATGPPATLRFRVSSERGNAGGLTVIRVE